MRRNAWHSVTTSAFELYKGSGKEEPSGIPIPIKKKFEFSMQKSPISASGPLKRTFVLIFRKVASREGALDKKGGKGPASGPAKGKKTQEEIIGRAVRIA